MDLPGTSEEKEVKLLLARLLKDKEEVFKFAVAAQGPKDGQLIVSKKEKLKKKDVQSEAEAEAKKNNGGKAVKLDVMVGECRLHEEGGSVLRLMVYGKAVARALSCIEHLIVRGPFKAVGFTAVILEEVAEPDDAPVSPPVSPPVATPTSETKPETNNAGELFNERLKSLLPAIKNAAGTPAGQDAKLKASEAGVLARKNDYVRANQLLDEAEQLLAAGPTSSTTSEQGQKGPDLAAQFNERLKNILPAIKSAAGTPAGEEAKLRASEAGVFARKQDFAQALQLLDQVDALLKSASPNSGPQGGPSTAEPTKSKSLEAVRKQLQVAIEAWRAANETVDDQIAKLQEALRNSGDEELEEISDRGMNALTGNFKVRLMALAQEVRDVADDVLPRLAARGKDIADGFQAHLESDPRIAAVDDNPFGVTVTIRSNLGKVLGQLSAAFQDVINA